LGADKLSLFSSFLSASTNCIFCITETWLTNDVANSGLCCQKKFSIYRTDRGGGKTGGGVAILVPSTLPSTCIFSLSNTSFEILSVLLGSKTTVILTLIYRPPGKDKNFQKNFENCYSKIVQKWQNTSHIICGDLNLNEICWQSLSAPKSSIGLPFLNFSLQKGFQQLVLEPTRGKNILDLVLQSVPFTISDLQVTDPFLKSDHSQIDFSFSIDQSKTVVSPKKYKNYRRANFEEIERQLCQIPWDVELGSKENIDEMYSTFLNIFSQIVDSNTPFSTPRPQQSIENKPEIIKLKKEKLNLYKKLKTERNNRTLQHKYNQISNIYRQKIRSFQVQTENSILLSGQDTKFWNYIRQKSNQKSVIPAIENNGSFVMCDQQKAELFSSFFSSVFTSDDGKLPQVTFSKIIIANCFFPPYLIFEKLKNLPLKFSAGPDGVSQFTLQKTAVSLAYPLSIIFKQSFETGTLPSQFKCANIVPIHKKNSKSKVENYRSISLTSVTCKVMESIVADHLTSFLFRHKKISEAQHGFLRRRSTVTQLLSCMNLVTETLDRGQFCDVFYLDIVKAFNSVSHPKLILIFESYGIRGKLLFWLIEYLNGRTQRVNINGKFSKIETVTSGVAEGSVLGPLFFIMYINNIVLHVKKSQQNSNSKLFLFADDCKLIFSHKLENNQLCQNDLDSIIEFMNIWQLKLSSAKCQVLNIGTTKSSKNIKCPKTYYLDNETLTSVVSARDLGVTMTNTLSWNTHCSNLALSANQKVNVIFRTFRCKNKNFLMQMYKTFVRSKLEYATPVWSPYHKADIAVIESVQRNFTRRIPELQKLELSYEERLRYLNLESLQLRRLKNDILLTHKILYGHLNVESKQFFHINNRNTRSNGLKLEKSYFNTDCRKYYFGNRVVDIWNSLPSNLVEIQDHHGFSCQLDQKLKSGAITFSKFIINIA